MKKIDFVRNIYSNYSGKFKFTTVHSIVEGLMVQMKLSLLRQEPIFIRGLGTIRVVNNNRSCGRNVRENKPADKKYLKRISFKASKSLLQSISSSICNEDSACASPKYK